MTKYKFNKDGSVDNLLTGQRRIHEGVWLWELYQEWLAAGNVTLPYIEDPEAIKAKVWGKIKVERDRRKDGGFKVEVEPELFKWFHSDIFSRTQHIGLANNARDLLAAGGTLSDIVQVSVQGQLVNVHWKTMDGTKVYITAQIAFDIVAAAESMDASLFYAGEQHETAMNESPDPLSYDFSTGWPEVFDNQSSEG